MSRELNDDQQDSTLDQSEPFHLENHLTTLAHSLIVAINTRQFALTSPLWSSLAPSFRASPHPPHRPLNATPAEFLAFLSNLADENPEWQCHATETTVYVNGKQGEVFMNVETMGIPVGIVTRSCALVKFREMKAKWRCVGYEGVNGGPGMEGNGGRRDGKGLD